jgi:hypothetical protein
MIQATVTSPEGTQEIHILKAPDTANYNSLYMQQRIYVQRKKGEKGNFKVYFQIVHSDNSLGPKSMEYPFSLLSPDFVPQSIGNLGSESNTVHWVTVLPESIGPSGEWWTK